MQQNKKNLTVTKFCEQKFLQISQIIAQEGADIP